MLSTPALSIVIIFSPSFEHHKKTVGMKIFSVAYWPNIEYLAHVIHEKEILIEAQENFVKQTYRNRCVILSPAGKQNLIVPVIGGRSKNKKLITQIQIDYSKHWVSNHINSIKTAYGSAPFFDFFFDEIKDLLQHRYTSLFELDIATLQMSFQLLGIDVKLNYTTNYIKDYQGNVLDLRNQISPKQPTNLDLPAYPQVFEDKLGFVPHLSSLDLIFNLGNEALSYLRSIKI